MRQSSVRPFDGAASLAMNASVNAFCKGASPVPPDAGGTQGARIEKPPWPVRSVPDRTNPCRTGIDAVQGGPEKSTKVLTM